MLLADLLLPAPVLQCGPVVAGACHIPLDVDIEGIDDSKELSAEKREALYETLTSHPSIRWYAPPASIYLRILPCRAVLMQHS